MRFIADIYARLDERFGHDTLIALATTDWAIPSVRTVNTFYEDGVFYAIAHALSEKVRHIALNPAVGICGEWFTAHGTAQSLGHILLPENADIADNLRTVFAEWYGNSHVIEDDPNTIILRICLTGSVLCWHGTHYDIEFS